MAIESTVEVDEVEYWISFYPNITHIGNDGIGGYEFWGQKGNDGGRDFVEEYEIIDLHVYDLDTDEEIAIEDSLREKIEDAIRNSRDVDEKIDRYWNDMKSYYEEEPRYE